LTHLIFIAKLCIGQQHTFNLNHPFRMIADNLAGQSKPDRRRLPKATPEKIKANKKARNQKYSRKTLPPWGFHRKPWTDQEKELILHKNGHSDHKLSKMLGRSVTCIQVQRSKLKSGKK